MAAFGVLFCLQLWLGLAHAQTVDYYGREIEDDNRPEVFGFHPGYLQDVPEEKNRREVEMVMLEEPPTLSKPISDVIFNQRLSKEFRDQYRYRFGQTYAEQVINSPGRFDEYTYYNTQNVTAQEYQKNQQKFGEYMGRRLTEYHFDKWAKSEPSVRPVYEFKDKVSNVNLEVKKGYKFKWKYQLSGPYMDLAMENPYEVDARIRYEMHGVLSSADEVIYSLGYPFTKRVRGDAIYRQYDGIYQLVLSRQLTSQLSTSLTGSVDTLPYGPVVQQNLVLVGLSWTE